MIVYIDPVDVIVGVKDGFIYIQGGIVDAEALLLDNIIVKVPRNEYLRVLSLWMDTKQQLDTQHAEFWEGRITYDAAIFTNLYTQLEGHNVYFVDKFKDKPDISG